MKNLLQQDNTPKPFKIGEIVKGEVIGAGHSTIFVDLSPRGTGVIYGREFKEAKEELKKIKIGDTVSAKVVNLENENGYVELSFSKANQEMSWKDLAQKRESGELIKVKILGANKGGLLTKVLGIPAFLPVSQLSAEHYPRVEKGDKSEILKALQKFIGKELKVRILDLARGEEKLILSEKAKWIEEKKKDALEKYHVGDIVEGEITGITDFGAFIRFPVPSKSDSLEGLIHISELDWGLIENPSQIVKVGQKIRAKIIDISNGRIYLSLKALKPDPWKDIEKKFKPGAIVQGKVTKFVPFGAFVQLAPKVQGLVHISEFNPQDNMTDILKVGKEYNFKILSIDPGQHRMSLKLEDSNVKSNSENQ